MPQTHVVSDWEIFFDRLMATDYSSPLFSAIFYLSILYHFDTAEFPSVYNALYRDIGIEMASEGCFPAKSAALNTGFLPKGISMFIKIFAEDASPKISLIMHSILGDHILSRYLSEDVLNKARKIASHASWMQTAM